MKLIITHFSPPFSPFFSFKAKLVLKVFLFYAGGISHRSTGLYDQDAFGILEDL
jgi:hypothetical protein